jgi:hypothetical protein
LVVASGLTCAQSRLTKKFADCKAFLGAFFQRTTCARGKGLPLLLDNGPTPAPTQLGTWRASLEWAFAVRLSWLPTYASWLAQVELIFRQVQRDVLTPSAFPSLRALAKSLPIYLAELNPHPTPIPWTYTKPKLPAKFGAPPPLPLAA